MGKLYCNIESKWCKGLKRGVCTWCGKPIDEVSRCPRLEKIETVRFSDLLKQVNFNDVFAAITKWFPDQNECFDGYSDVFNQVRYLEPGRHYLNDLYIDITVTNEDGSSWLDVHGIELNKQKMYGIEFRSWQDWISMFITKETLETLTPEEIVGACLYEMTFFGFNESKINDMTETINASVEAMMKLQNNK